MKKFSYSDYKAFGWLAKHFWAKRHHQYTKQAKMGQDKQLARRLAREYVEEFILPNFQEPELEARVSVQSFETKSVLDFVIHTATDSFHVGFALANKLSSEVVDYMAFRAIAASKSFVFTRQFVILVNQFYARGEDLDLSRLFKVVEVTALMEKQTKSVRHQLESMKKVDRMESCTHLDSCLHPEVCPCPLLCHPKLPEYSIYDIRGLPSKKKQSLRDQGIISMVDVPIEFLEYDSQLKQRSMTRNQSQSIDSHAIRTKFDQLVWPLFFLDYEAYNFPIPLFPGYWPGSTVVFQFSLHRLDQSGNLDQFEFLHLETTDPAPALVAALKESLGETGSIFVWDRRLEEENHRHLSQLHPQDMLFLLDLNQRMFDLRDIFSRGLYEDYRFKGSSSLKKVLPVLVPEMNHDDLDISHGLEAANQWYELVFRPNGQDKEQVTTRLREYCQMDTLALVKIYQHLVDQIKT